MLNMYSEKIKRFKDVREFEMPHEATISFHECGYGDGTSLFMWMHMQPMTYYCNELGKFEVAEAKGVRQCERAYILSSSKSLNEKMILLARDAANLVLVDEFKRLGVYSIDLLEAKWFTAVWQYCMQCELDFIKPYDVPQSLTQGRVAYFELVKPLLASVKYLEFLQSKYGKKKSKKKMNITVGEANIELRKLLNKFPTINIREAAGKIGCSTGLIAKCGSWKGIQEQRIKNAKPKKPLVVNLSDESLAVVDSHKVKENLQKEQLSRMVEFQRKDDDGSPFEKGRARRICRKEV